MNDRDDDFRRRRQLVIEMRQANNAMRQANEALSYTKGWIVSNRRGSLFPDMVKLDLTDADGDGGPVISIFVRRDGNIADEVMEQSDAIDKLLKADE